MSLTTARISMIPDQHLKNLHDRGVNENILRELDRMYRLTVELTGTEETASAIAFYAYLSDGLSELGERLRRYVKNKTAIAAVDLARVAKEVQRTHASRLTHSLSKHDKIASHLEQKFNLNAATANDTAALLEPLFHLNTETMAATVAPLFGVDQKDYTGRTRLANEFLRVATDSRPVLEVPGRYVLTVSFDAGTLHADFTEALARGIVSEASGGTIIPGEVHFSTYDSAAGPLRQVLSEFELLINNAQATENDLQRFFENRPEFLCMLGDYDDIRSQVTVRLESALSPLCGKTRGFRPDFFLRSSLTGRWDVLDIKRAQINSELVVGSGNSAHDSLRPSALLSKALNQMRQYQVAFNQVSAKDILKQKYGMVVSQPRIILLMGLSVNFPIVQGFERTEMISEVGDDVDIILYDQLFQVAKHRWQL